MIAPAPARAPPRGPSRRRRRLPNAFSTNFTPFRLPVHGFVREHVKYTSPSFVLTDLAVGGSLVPASILVPILFSMISRSHI
ncbi:hypothetical protein EVAR_54511_1 [Eumeta japonica]|uniref:Uncharacterized protein n=1 Tax=Eumeta variegata TaxID=151549 RepID=A0A4C1YH70_EUMVA|nr:hypothetical protein EVAR_54511_1 [Eumeta japonica]